MICDKCGSGYMVDDSHGGINVYKCCICGNRFYVDYPKRYGSLVCSRCGDDMDTQNEWGYCKNCLKLLDVPAERMKERTYGETTCACGTIFIRKSPRQLFHAKDCKKRLTALRPEGHWGAGNPATPCGAVPRTARAPLNTRSTLAVPRQ